MGGAARAETIDVRGPKLRRLRFERARGFVLGGGCWLRRRARLELLRATEEGRADHDQALRRGES
jgi:hypothetical protein